MSATTGTAPKITVNPGDIASRDNRRNNGGRDRARGFIGQYIAYTRLSALPALAGIGYDTFSNSPFAEVAGFVGTRGFLPLAVGSTAITAISDRMSRGRGSNGSISHKKGRGGGLLKSAKNHPSLALAGLGSAAAATDWAIGSDRVLGDYISTVPLVGAAGFAAYGYHKRRKGKTNSSQSAGQVGGKSKLSNLRSSVGDGLSGAPERLGKMSTSMKIAAGSVALSAAGLVGDLLNGKDAYLNKSLWLVPAIGGGLATAVARTKENSRKKAVSLHARMATFPGKIYNKAKDYNSNLTPEERKRRRNIGIGLIAGAVALAGVAAVYKFGFPSGGGSTAREVGERTVTTAGRKATTTTKVVNEVNTNASGAATSVARRADSATRAANDMPTTATLPRAGGAGTATEIVSQAVPTGAEQTRKLQQFYDGVSVIREAHPNADGPELNSIIRRTLALARKKDEWIANGGSGEAFDQQFARFVQASRN